VGNFQHRFGLDGGADDRGARSCTIGRAISVPGINQPGDRAYPLVDHIADKVAAIIEPHGDGRASTRFRDLIDLVELIVSVHVTASEQRVAILSEIDRRGLQLSKRFTVPDRALWEGGFARATRRAVRPSANTLDEALAIAGPFLDPVLDGSAVGSWYPEAGEWIPRPQRSIQVKVGD
jgi:hypothetical protein